MTERMKTVGELLIDLLEDHGVELVFGIPGVHTVELYRGLAGSRIRHITPRHEQGAGFMADGYARVSGKPGVCLLITGPGLTNAITAMAQARADSVPMLVISSVNARGTLGHGRGKLHELPDQRALVSTVARFSHTLLDPDDLPEIIARAFAILSSARPGPVHIEIPTDVMEERVARAEHNRPAFPVRPPRADADTLARLIELCQKAERPTIIAGGGARFADERLRELAEHLDAPMVLTVNGRGLLARHPLSVPASPSLAPVRELLTGADLVLAIGTEMGPTDFDMYDTGGFPALQNLVRVDIDADQLARGPAATLSILSSAENLLTDMLAAESDLPDRRGQKGGAARVEATRRAVLAGLSPAYRRAISLLDMIGETLPGVIMVGDSTQPIYAGNLYCEISRPGGWFNSATGYGSLGYGPPAAIGAALAAPDQPVVAITGDGGFQFSLAELGSAVDEGTDVIFLVWNSHGYQEIETHMQGAGVTPIGVRPSAPDFVAIANAYGMKAERLERADELAAALARAREAGGPYLIEMMEPGPSAP
ncbi:MAG TPA: 5-guanidino-2-oxopentanoate decarboxylase [Paracoccaceae bacterium]|nr:5-guanidino-2-oxopentanoate decarboxylase [Paracoccaceae bacterium]